MSDPKKLICLISRECHDRVQSSNQSRALGWLAARYVPHTVVDGGDPRQRELRDRLFGISGVRGNYPQFFFELRGGAIELLGNFERVESLNETNGLPPEVLARHPELETWDKVFGSTLESFS